MIQFKRGGSDGWSQVVLADGQPGLEIASKKFSAICSRAATDAELSGNVPRGATYETVCGCGCTVEGVPVQVVLSGVRSDSTWGYARVTATIYSNHSSDVNFDAISAIYGILPTTYQADGYTPE